MSKHARQSQHRPERETVKGRELSEAKKQIKQLKKLVGRQQKQIRRLQDMLGMEDSPDIEESPPETMASAEGIKPTQGVAQIVCNSCEGSNLTEIATPSGIVIVCRSCKHRWKSESPLQTEIEPGSL